MDENDETQVETLEQVQKERDEYLDSWKRTAADFENFKRRKLEEEKELVTFAREYAIVKLLPTLDSLSQAILHRPKQISDTDYENWSSGLLGILEQLDKALTELGIQKIESVGKKFDPNYHEAIREIESEDEEGFVLEEYVTGYQINNKVIRPSQVGISKKVIQQ